MIPLTCENSNLVCSWIGTLLPWIFYSFLWWRGGGRAEYGYSLELQNRSYLLIPYLQLCQKNMRRHTSQLTEYPLIRIRKKKSVILKWQHCCVNFTPICNSDEPIVSNHPKRNDLTWGSLLRRGPDTPTFWQRVYWMQFLSYIWANLHL